MNKKLANEQHIILFDGVCNLCNSSVQFVIERDNQDIFSFASLQSETAHKFKSSLGLNPDQIDSIVYITNDRFYVKSDAALEVGYKLGGWSKLLYVFKPVPRFIRDGVYDFIAKNRYKWFGKEESCMLPTPATRKKFLE